MKLVFRPGGKVNAMLFAWTEDRDARHIANGGSDRLIDQLLGWGDEAAVKAAVQAHLDAGASHVCVQAINPDRPSHPDFAALEAVLG